MMIFNALGLPVTQCPLGFNGNGLPIGVQVTRLSKHACNLFITLLVRRTTVRFFLLFFTDRRQSGQRSFDDRGRPRDRTSLWGLASTRDRSRALKI